MAVYLKTLTPTDISIRLEVNANRLRGFFPAFEAGQYRQVLDVEDEDRKNWKFVLCIRQGQYEKPFISQATWRPFVEEKQAEVGDAVEFSRETDGASGSACRYKIRLIKKGMKKEEKEVMENEENEVINNEKKEVKLFGAIIGYSNN
ncbi:hypothetical protein CICLE_v10003395mg [Citrus x clementina]|uniref:TF-B3 domain-containing protein n=1 Tax=Citrus clementina TaxID=85681 RepID=V4UXR4_CITCL|nr:hypothetical protein CICLE_v10003395mg [Citrus x clementina]